MQNFSVIFGAFIIAAAIMWSATREHHVVVENIIAGCERGETQSACQQRHWASERQVPYHPTDEQSLIDAARKRQALP